MVPLQVVGGADPGHAGPDDEHVDRVLLPGLVSGPVHAPHSFVGFVGFVG
jgi:hypothetical protein